MENWGMLLFDPTAILLDPQDTGNWINQFLITYFVKEIFKLDRGLLTVSTMFVFCLSNFDNRTCNFTREVNLIKKSKHSFSKQIIPNPVCFGTNY